MALALSIGTMPVSANLSVPSPLLLWDHDDNSVAGPEPNVDAHGLEPAVAAAVMPTAPSPPGIAPPSVEINQVENAHASGLAGLTEQFGATCFMGSHVLVGYPPDHGKRLDAQIDAADLSGEAWLELDGVWLGTADRAAEAFGAARLYVDAHEVWIELSNGDTPMLAQLVSTTTPAGRTVWSILNTDTVTTCD